MQLTKNNIATIFTMTLLHIGLLSIINKNIFEVYIQVILYVYTLLVCVYYGIKRRHNKSEFLFLCGTIIYMIISIVLTGGGMGSVLTFSLAMMLLSMLADVQFTMEQRRELSVLCYCINIYIFFYSIKYASNWKYYMLNDINPNTLGMYLMFTFMLWDNLYHIKNKWKYRILFVLILIVTFKGMLNLQSRGTMVAVVLFLVLKSVPLKIFKSDLVFPIAMGIMVVCTVFPFIFLNLYKNNFEFVFLGKSLYTGREKIWTTMFEQLNNTKRSWLVGLGSKAQIRVRHGQNIHNDYFATIVNFGLIGFALHSTYMIGYLKRACDMLKSSETNRKWIYMFIASVLMLGATETVTHWAAIFVFSYLSLGMAVSEEKEDVEHDT